MSVSVCSSEVLPRKMSEGRWSGSDVVEPSDWEGAADYTETFFSDQWMELTDAEKSALNFYKSGQYASLNDALRTGSVMSDEMRVTMANIDSALAKMQAPDDMLVRRFSNAESLEGVLQQSVEEEVFWGDDPMQSIGSIFADDAYTSTSLASDFNWGGSDTIEFVIRVPQGYNCGPNDVVLMDRSLRTAGTTEGEIMLKRGTRFRIIDMVTNHSQGAWQIEKMTLEVVP